MANRLKKEKSPYLLQHGDNPVDWYPWCEEAFARAEREDKPVFLSIGYSTCHWCHVMAHESFEDKEVAELLDRGYICIKVDREERPDIDAVYMAACQAVTGSGGWPLTIVMTPDQKPFFAGTYFPKRRSFGRPGLMEILEEILVLWRERREEIVESGEAITAAIRGKQEGRALREEQEGRALREEQEGRTLREERRREPGEKGPDERELFRQAYRIFSQQFDPVWGGFGSAPKFPSPHNLLFLMRYSREEHVPEGLYMAERTLEAMAEGGIFDHIGGGFSRYSTDERWLVPHFEKMLYDNALLILAYLEAYQITKKAGYGDTVRRTADYILRELTDAQGGFYCGQDADSDGVEGKYYVFTPEEVEAVLGKAEGDAFCRRYGITREGNFEGKSIPNRIRSSDGGRREEHFRTARKAEELRKESADPQKADGCREESADPQKADGCREESAGRQRAEGYWKDLGVQKLYRYRKERAGLHKDDKILLSWNAWTMTALARAGRILGESRYLKAAERAAQFVEEHMAGADGRLYLRFREGELGCKGQLEDYAVYVLALLELYRSTFRVTFLEKAILRARQMIELFEDKERGGYFLYGSDAGELIARPKEMYDGAIPSGNSAAAMALKRLASLTGEKEWLEAAGRQLAYCAGQIQGYPAGYAYTLLAMMEEVYPHKELICTVSGVSGGLSEELLRPLMAMPAYGLDILVKTGENGTALAGCVPFTAGYPLPEEGEMYYLCENGACRAPVEKIEKLGIN